MKSGTATSTRREWHFFSPRPVEAPRAAGADFDQGKLGDIIAAVNGRSVAWVSDLAREFEAIGIGKPAELTVARNGKERRVEVQIEDLNAK